MKTRRVWKMLCGVLVLPGALWHVAARWAPFPAEKLERGEQNLWLLDAEGIPLRRLLAASGKDADWLGLGEMGEWAPRAMVAVEDQRFHRHGGVDGQALLRAVGQNLVAGEVVSGASTLTTQVIRLLEPRPRTLWTKVVEAFRATQLEQRHDKAFILEQYLNRAPFGGNRQGLASAARVYFGKDPNALSAGEAALLAGLPQSPSRFRPDRWPERAERRRATVLRRMREEGMLGAAPLLNSRPCAVDPPFRAPHFTDWFLSRHPGKSGRVGTTLDPRAQSRLEEEVAAYRAEAGAQGIDGIGLVLLDVGTGSVLGMVGGFDPGNPRHGRVNSALRRRSPGSTLKPFVYALAMQQGWLRPDSPIEDLPRAHPGHLPRNMDGRGGGTVDAAGALARSLNLPALAVAERLGIAAGLELLRAAGIQGASIEPARVGLGYALGGGIEASLLELCGAYACFARDGRPVRPTAFPGDGGPLPALFSPAVVFWISRALSSESRGLQAFGHVADLEMPTFAYKTGTSHGHRDAWAIGWNGDRVLGVWLGRMDGAAVPGLGGGSHAAPLLARLAPDLLPGDVLSWPIPPPELRTSPRGEWIAGVSDPAAAEAPPLPRILSPPPEFELRLEQGGQGWLSLRAADPAGGSIHWFVDGQWIGASPSSLPLARLFDSGRYTLRAVFSDGSSETRRIVLLPPG